MGDYNIPIIEPAIDYTKVPPINQKRTIAFINNFISQTASFLNKFALTCEEKLYECENKLQRVEASLELLESRISSISGLENEKAEIKVESNEEDIENKEQENNTSVEVEERNEETKSEVEMQSISMDPVYQKFFKMIHFGVPKPAVKLKMEQEGLDSSVLE